MATFTPSTHSAPVQPGLDRNAGPLAIVTVLFFMWGLLTALNDVLIPHLKAVYTLTYVQAMLVQFCFFGAYFIISVPAGLLIRRIGYKAGVVAGLGVAALGCLLFYPAAESGYGLFLFAFFVLASGITVLLLCMAIVGGAILPFVQGLVADGAGLQLSFLVPAACYLYILYFGLKYAGMYHSERNA